jgi:hypothetical protein
MGPISRVKLEARRANEFFRSMLGYSENETNLPFSFAFCSPLQNFLLAFGQRYLADSPRAGSSADGLTGKCNFHDPSPLLLKTAAASDFGFLSSA